MAAGFLENEQCRDLILKPQEVNCYHIKMFGIVLNFTLVVNVKNSTRPSSLGVAGVMMTMLTGDKKAALNWSIDLCKFNQEHWRNISVAVHSHTHNYLIVCMNENPITSR